MKLTPYLKHQLGGMLPEYQDKLAEMLNYASSIGDYGDPPGEIAVVSAETGEVLFREKDCR